MPSAQHGPTDGGRIAVITGATRGVGKGIALGLARPGWTIHVTGRTETGPTSLEATASAVEARGAVAVAHRCDHADDAQVREVFARVEAAHGRLDLLVNNVFAVPAEPIWERRFWEKPIALWDQMHTVGLRSHYVASVLGAPMMLATAQQGGRPLIVHVSSFAGGGYQLDVAYGVGKAALDRMAADMAKELRSHGVAVVSLWPGIVRTEWVEQLASPPFPMAVTESPELSGRAVAALADDPEIARRSGQVCVVAELAEDYGFDDIDGTRPRSLRRRTRPRRQAGEEGG